MPGGVGAPEELGEDTIALKKTNLRALLRGSKERSKRRATSLPARSSRDLLDNIVFIATVKHGWTKATELIRAPGPAPAGLSLGAKAAGCTI